jgi:hypothetical protein
VEGKVEDAIALIKIMSEQGITMRVADLSDEQQKIN